ncbi:MAG: response regulator transcription factor [Kineosporiaceae bacterium]
MIRVLVVDDQALVRAGFCALLEATDGVEVVGEAGDGEQAVELAEQLAPDVVLMDIRMPRLDGISATRRLSERAERPRVLILTTFDTDDNVFDALEAGAVGFLVKDTPPTQLLDAVRAAVDGGAVISPVTTRRLVDRIVASRTLPPAPARRPAAPALEVLTDREREVLERLARGQSNREIAGSLSISELTAKTHVSRVLGKLGLTSRVQAAVFAYETGLVRPGELPRAGYPD